MSFNPANLQAKLAGVNETQESITTVAQWIMFHKRNAETSASVWADTVKTTPDKNKLGLLYVANEVVQQAKIRGRDNFVEAFGRVIPDAFRALSSLPPPTLDKVTRVVRVWHDRNVFPPQTLQSIEAALPSNSGSRGAPVASSNGSKSQGAFFSSPASSANNTNKSLGNASGQVPSALAGVAQTWQTSESEQVAWIAASAAVDKKFSEVYSDHAPAPIEYLQQVEGLQKLVGAANSSATSLSSHYSELISQLGALITSLETKNIALGEGIADLLSKTNKIETTRKELLEVLNGDDELPSPDIEPPTPENGNSPDIGQEEEYTPAMYTSKEAAAGHDAAATGADELGYAPDSEDENEPEQKKAKVELAPDLASFLANIAK